MTTGNFPFTEYDHKQAWGNANYHIFMLNTEI